MSKGIYIKYILLSLIVSSILIIMYLGNSFYTEQFSNFPNAIGSSFQSGVGNIQGQMRNSMSPMSMPGSVGYVASSVSNIPGLESKVLLLPGVPMPDELEIPETRQGEIGNMITSQLSSSGKIQQAVQNASGKMEVSTIGNISSIPYKSSVLQIPPVDIKGPMQVPSGISYTMPSGMLDNYQQKLQLPSGIPSGVPLQMQMPSGMPSQNMPFGMPNMPPGMPNMPPGMPSQNMPFGMPNMPPGMPSQNMPPGMPNMPPGMPNMPPGMPSQNMSPGMPNMPCNMPPSMPNMSYNMPPGMPSQNMPPGMPNMPYNMPPVMPNMPPGMPSQNMPSAKISDQTAATNSKSNTWSRIINL